eukprot:PITA_10809
MRLKDKYNVWDGLCTHLSTLAQEYGPDHLSCIETGEEPTSLEEGLSDAQLIVVHIVYGHFEDIIHFLMTGTALKEYSVQQKKKLVVHGANFFVIVRHLYKMGNDEILRRYVPEMEQSHILVDVPGDAMGGHHVGRVTAQNILRRDEMPLNAQMLLQPFEKWVIAFIGPIKPHRTMGARYIINAIEYLIRWAEVQPVKDCMAAMIVNFLFEHVSHQKRTPYHPQGNGIVEAFNKILETALTKVCNVQRSDWDLCVLVVLWAYRMTCKKLMGRTPLQLVYGVEAVMPMEFIMPSLCIAVLTAMKDHGAMEERLA